MLHPYLKLLVVSSLIYFLYSFSTVKELDSIIVRRGAISISQSYSENELSLSVSTTDPVALRTLIMQGFKLSICMGKADTIYLLYPSAKDVEQSIKHHPGEVKATIKDNHERRPDLRPVIAALNDSKIKLVNGCDTTIIDRLLVNIDTGSGELSYTVSLPCTVVTSKVSTVILHSLPTEQMVNKDEFSSQGYRSYSYESQEQPFGAGKTIKDSYRTINYTYEF